MTDLFPLSEQSSRYSYGYETPKADVVVIGLGWSGSLMCEELTRAGLNVIAIDRGPWTDTSTHTPPAVDPDELRWASRKELLRKPRDLTTV